jgi:hypothetical protein
MKSRRNILLTVLIFGLVAALCLCVLSSASSAQSKDDRKDRSGGEQKREEPKREDRSERETSGDRAAEREPIRERKDASGGDRTSREQPSRGGGADKGRQDTKERDAVRDRNRAGGSGSADKRTVPDRDASGGTAVPDRTRPPVRPDAGTYDRRRGEEGGSGLRPGNANPPIRPPRSYPEDEEDGGTKKKDVPLPGDRIRIITEGWPGPPPWHRDHVRIGHVYPGFLPDDPYLIQLPFGTIRPRGIEDEFLTLLNDLWKDGMDDALLVCIIQTYRELDVDRFELFFDAEDDATVYGSFTPNSFLALISVYSIFELLDDPRIRWIGEYKPYYKINRSVRLWEYDGVFVFPLEGDMIECRDDLADIYLVPEFYDEELGFYFIPAESYELEAISEFWWVAEVLQVVSDPDLVYDYDYTTYE